MANVLLDASALLAVINSEPGKEVIDAALPGAAISAINYAEVVSKLVERGIPTDEIDQSLAAFRLPIIEFDAGLAIKTGHLRRQTKDYGLSLGDRACLALAEREGLPVLTTDRDWSKLSLGIEIRIVR